MRIETLDLALRLAGGILIGLVAANFVAANSLTLTLKPGARVAAGTPSFSLSF